MSFTNDREGRKFDFAAWQRTFPDRVAAYFKGKSCSWIERNFGLSRRTAYYWQEGIVEPRASKLTLISIRDPEGFEQHFRKDVAA